MPGIYGPAMTATPPVGAASDAWNAVIGQMPILQQLKAAQALAGSGVTGGERVLPRPQSVGEASTQTALSIERNKRKPGGPMSGGLTQPDLPAQGAQPVQGPLPTGGVVPGVVTPQTGPAPVQTAPAAIPADANVPSLANPQSIGSTAVEALGMGGFAPYFRAGGAGLAAGADAKSNFEGFAKAFGAAQKYQQDRADTDYKRKTEEEDRRYGRDFAERKLKGEESERAFNQGVAGREIALKEQDAPVDRAYKQALADAAQGKKVDVNGLRAAINQQTAIDVRELGDELDDKQGYLKSERERQYRDAGLGSSNAKGTKDDPHIISRYPELRDAQLAKIPKGEFFQAYDGSIYERK